MDTDRRRATQIIVSQYSIPNTQFHAFFLLSVFGSHHTVI